MCRKAARSGNCANRVELGRLIDGAPLSGLSHGQRCGLRPVRLSNAALLKCEPEAGRVHFSVRARDENKLCSPAEMLGGAAFGGMDVRGRMAEDGAPRGRYGGKAHRVCCRHSLATADTSTSVSNNLRATGWPPRANKGPRRIRCGAVSVRQRYGASGASRQKRSLHCRSGKSDGLGAHGASPGRLPMQGRDLDDGSRRPIQRSSPNSL